VQDISPVLSAGLKLPQDYGVLVADVLPGSPAAAAGLKPRDIITTLDTKAIEFAREFELVFFRRQKGDQIAVNVLRDGHELPETIVIESKPNTKTKMTLSPIPSNRKPTSFLASAFCASKFDAKGSQNPVRSAQGRWHHRGREITRWSGPLYRPRSRRRHSRHERYAHRFTRILPRKCGALQSR